MSELKPCPWCGSDNIKHSKKEMFCTNCHMPGPCTDDFDIDGEREKQWNQRPPIQITDEMVQRAATGISHMISRDNYYQCEDIAKVALHAALGGE